MSTTVTPLLPGNWYHIYNRGINGETLFHTPANYTYFLELLAKHLCDMAQIYAYCLMKNHFHLLVRIGENLAKEPHRYFSNLFNAYAQAINKQEGRKGSLFERPFRRKLIQTEMYRAKVAYYIHSNPTHHKVVADFRTYPYSSYRAILSNAPTKLQRDDVLNWFGGREGFIDYHNRPFDEFDDDLKLEP